MRGATHVALGVLVSAAAGVHGVPGLAAAALGSLLPDVDCPGSGLGKRAPGSRLGRLGRAAVGGGLLLLGLSRGSSGLLSAGLVLLALALLPHRGLTHSAAGLAVFAFAWKALFPSLLFPFAAGYTVHLFADALTPSGVPLLWPWSRTFGLGLVRSGGILDGVLCVASVACLGLMILAK